MSLTDVIVGAVVGGCIGIAGGVVAVKYEWRRHVDFEIINKVYEPLYKKIIERSDSITKNIGLFSADLTFFREIKKNYWYSRVTQKISKKLEDWQSRVSEYNAVWKEMREKIEQAINQEVERRAALLEPSRDRDRLVSGFKENVTQGFMYSGATGYSLLIQGKINDEDYYFLENFKCSGPDAEREIKVKLASGFPNAIYEEIRKDPTLTNLYDRVKKVEDATARLREVLEKQKKNRFMRRFYIFKKKSI